MVIQTLLLPSIIVAVPLTILFALEFRTTPDTADITFSHNHNDSPYLRISSDVAATPLERISGLSDYTEPPTGLLFVHPFQLTHGYVMRNMDFAIDIVFINSDGTVTEIHSEIPPESDETYTGVAKHVLELPSGNAAKYGISVGDTAEVTTPSSESL